MRWVEELRKILRQLRGDASAVGAEDISCQEALERLFEWLDGDLDPEMERRVGAHLETCARCYPRLLFERSFKEAVARAARAQEVPRDLPGRIRDQLRDEGFPG